MQPPRWSPRRQRHHHTPALQHTRKPSSYCTSPGLQPPRRTAALGRCWWFLPTRTCSWWRQSAPQSRDGSPGCSGWRRLRTQTQPLWNSGFCTHTEKPQIHQGRANQEHAVEFRQAECRGHADLASPRPLLGSAHTSLEVQEKPPVAEVEVSVVTVLVHQLEELRVQDLMRKAKANSTMHTGGSGHAPACSPLLPLQLPPSASLLHSPGTRYSRLTLQPPAPHHCMRPPSQDQLSPSWFEAVPLCRDSVTWIRDLMLAKWVSMAPPWGKF